MIWIALRSAHWLVHLAALAAHGYFSIYAFFVLFWEKEYDEVAMTWQGAKEIFGGNLDNWAEIISIGIFAIPFAVLAIFLRCPGSRTRYCGVAMALIWISIFVLSNFQFAAVSAFLS